MAEKGTVFVVGSGAAGNAAARYLVARDWRVVQADRDRWGGTCLWRGCIPKKSLYTSARSLRAIREAEQYGLGAPNPAVDWQTVLAWKWHAQETYAGDPERIALDRGIEVVHGEARFISPDEIEVEGARFAPDHIVVASGSESVVPDIPGFELCDTSDDALRYPAVPRTLVIVGGGFIAAEMAGIYASFGTEVTIVTHATRLLDMLDEDLSAAATRGLERLGVRLLNGCTVTGVDGAPGSLSALVSDAAGHAAAVPTERVLLAIGRRPSVRSLELHAGGVEVDGRGHIVVDPYLRTTNPRVWAAGDAAGGMMQTPVANLEGRTVAASIDDGLPQHADCSAMPITCFTVPQVASVGLTERTARDAGHETVVHVTTDDAIGAAVIEGDVGGFTKLVLDARDNRLLGAQVAGPYAGEAIYTCALALRGGLSSDDIARTAAVHPTYAESVYYSGY